MFDTTNIQITVPPGPYPDCGKPVMVGNTWMPCNGTLLPKVEPARTKPDDGSPGFYWFSKGIALFWQCSRCGKRV
jgi:hypothetical protein